MATSIFDRYIAAVGVKNFPNDQVILLATVSVLLSAKLEQPMSPSFTRMIGLLSDEEKSHVTKEALRKLEAEIIVKFGCDFNFQGPIAPLERYLRLLNYDTETTVFKLAVAILKGTLTQQSFMHYQPSMMAACTLITSINLFDSHKDNKSGQKKLMNTDIWNNKAVHESTGYSILDLRICLYEICVFCVEKLKSHQLERFHLDAIRTVKQYK